MVSLFIRIHVIVDKTVIHLLTRFCLDCQHEDWILQNFCTSSYSGPSEKEKALIGGGKAGGGVTEVRKADEARQLI